MKEDKMGVDGTMCGRRMWRDLWGGDRNENTWETCDRMWNNIKVEKIENV
jgi:hypothetical protein